MQGKRGLPRIIWFLWLQGFNSAPEVVRACLESWHRHNPGWTVRSLDENDLTSVLPNDVLERAYAARQNPEAFSDCVRIELLHRYGGVWADATALCLKPLDEWLPGSLTTGFFAFERPGPDRMIASWFLAAEKGSYVIEQWRRRVVEFWKERADRGQDYFWFHRLFADEANENKHFLDLWNRTPKMPAAHDGHFSPFDARLMQPASREQVAMLAQPPSPVFKLTHKLPADVGPRSLLHDLCHHAYSSGADRSPSSRKKLLITWYGSFAGHGTIGDLRALESVVTHVVGRGHDVTHATAGNIDVPGATRISLDEAEPNDYDGVGFVCGPILNFHPQTNALFQRFQARRLAGIGVSILPADHKYFSNPFSDVIAREGGPTNYGDVAIVAPTSVFPAIPKNQFVIGLALRGIQADYGEGTCLWQQTESVAFALASTVLRQRRGHTLTIDNHLTRSGKTPDEIEQQYAACDLIITSRFHGAITAMRYGVPFIALDQIRGGAKVYSLLNDLGCRHVYRVDLLEQVDLRPEMLSLTHENARADVIRYRQHAVEAAMRTLLQVDRWVASLP